MLFPYTLIINILCVLIESYGISTYVLFDKVDCILRYNGENFGVHPSKLKLYGSQFEMCRKLANKAHHHAGNMAQWASLAATCYYLLLL